MKKNYMRLISLSSDFGTKDPDLSLFKSRIFNEFSDFQVVDVTHQLTPFDSEETLYILKNALPHFPKNAIHFIAFNTEVYEKNLPILIKTPHHYFLSFDNGIMPLVLEGINYQAYYLDTISFDGFMTTHIQAMKNILSEKLSLDSLRKVDELKKIKLSKPVIKYEGDLVKQIFPKVIYVDHYGNAVFNLTEKDFENYRQNRKFSVNINLDTIQKISKGYNDLSDSGWGGISGKAGVRFNTFGYFEIFINGSNQQTGGANNLLGLGKNEQIKIIFD